MHKSLNHNSPPVQMMHSLARDLGLRGSKRWYSKEVGKKSQLFPEEDLYRPRFDPSTQRYNNPKWGPVPPLDIDLKLQEVQANSEDFLRDPFTSFWKNIFNSFERGSPFREMAGARFREDMKPAHLQSALDKVFNLAYVPKS